MKVMMIVARLNIGGVALNVLQTVSALQKNESIEVILIHGRVSEHEGDMYYLAENLGVRSVILPALERELSPIHDLKTIWQLYRLMRQHRPDIVHTHTAKAGFVGRWAAFLARIPVRVHTFHGHVFHGYFGPLKTRLFLWMERLSALISSRIITLSEALRTELSEVYSIAPKNKIEVIPLGLDLQSFTRLEKGHFRQQWNLPADAPLVAVVGRLVPIKNHLLFLQAAKLVHDRRPDVRFLIVGDGELRQDIEQQIRAWDFQKVITITGWIQDMTPVYSNVSLVTITSDNEGTPVSLIEAIAAGIPVVSTDVGGVRDLFKENFAAQLVPPNDPEKLAQAWLDTLANPPDMASARTRIFQEYDIHTLADRLIKLYLALGKREESVL